MSNKTLIAVCAGIISAIAATAFINQLPGAFMLVYIADLPLFLIGFSFGPQSALISSFAGFLITGILGGGLAAIIFVLLQIIPTWLVVRLMLLQRPMEIAKGSGVSETSKKNIEWYPAGNMVCWLSIMVVGILFLASLVSLSSGQGSLSALISDNLDKVIQTMAPTWDPEQRTKIVDLMVPMFPGAVGISWLIMTIFNAILAQNILCKFTKDIRPTPAYIDLYLPHWISWPLIASCTLALLGTGELEYVSRNISMILLLPFFLLGLAVIHTWVQSIKKGRRIFLILFYSVLILLNWTALVVAGLGLIELWNGIRSRIVGST